MVSRNQWFFSLSHTLHGTGVYAYIETTPMYANMAVPPVVFGYWMHLVVMKPFNNLPTAPKPSGHRQGEEGQEFPL